MGVPTYEPFLCDGPCSDSVELNSRKRADGSSQIGFSSLRHWDTPRGPMPITRQVLSGPGPKGGDLTR